MGALKKMLQRHREEIAQLRAECEHETLRIRKDRSCIGRGTRFPSIRIVCPNCGKAKLMFIESDEEAAVEIKKTLERQDGIKDQRETTFEYEFEYEDELA